MAFFATVGGAMVAADPAFAKVDVDNLTIGGEVRIRYEIRNNTSFNSNNTNESAASHRVRLNVGYDLTPDVSFFMQFQDARIWGTEGPGTGNAFNQSGEGTVSAQNQNNTGLDLHQGYLLLKNVGVPGLSLKAGRQEIYYGDHRLFGNFNWSQIGNSFDAVKLMYSNPMADVDVFWARVFDTETGAGCTGANSQNCSGVIFPGNNTTGRGFGTTGQDIYGAYVTLKMVPNWTIEPYYFLLQDTRTAVAGNLVTVPQAADQTRSTLGGRINGRQGIAGGALDATAELAWQFGGMASGTGANPQQHDVHINAWAGAAKAGYTFDAVPMKPRIGIEIDYASGTNCPPATCKKNNTFDNLFPTNHFKYGAMDLMAWKNMVVYQAVFDVKPDAVSKFQVNFDILRLADHFDNWYRSAQVVYGATGVTNTSSSIGRELDVHYYRTFKEKFKFEIGAGHFWAGQYITSGQNAINSAAGSAINGSGQNWGYVMGSVLF